MNEAEFQKLLDSDEPVIIPASRNRYILQSCIWLVIPILFALNHVLLVSGICLLFAILGFKRAYSLGDDCLMLDDAGFSEKILNVQIKRLWKDVSAFKKEAWNVKFNDNSKHNGTLNKLIVGTNDSIHNTYAITTKQLAQLMNQWRERALAKQPNSQ